MIKVLYGGYLRPFKHVGHHPQFEHIRYPPPGYEFVTGGHFGLRTPARLLKSISALSWNAVANGSTLSGLTKFIHSRSLVAQLSVPSDVSLAFLPSMPFILGQIPWVIEIEDTTTLFAPFRENFREKTGPAALRDRWHLRFRIFPDRQGFTSI